MGWACSLLDEGAVGGVAEPRSVGPYRLDARALQQGEPVPVGLEREQNGEYDGWFVEAAVVVQLADGHAERFSAVRVLRFDQRVPVLYPQVAEHRPDLPGPVPLPAYGDAFSGQVVPVAMNKCGFGALGFSRLAGRG